MSVTIRITEEHKEFIDEVAEQLDTSRKEVLEYILDWFFSEKGSGLEEPEEPEEGEPESINDQ